MKVVITDEKDGVTPDDLQLLLRNVTARVRLLLTPLCGGLPEQESPSTADIKAATTTLRLCDNVVNGLRARCSGEDMKSKAWLHDNDWMSLKSLLKEHANKLKAQQEDITNRHYTDADRHYTDADRHYTEKDRHYTETTQRDKLKSDDCRDNAIRDFIVAAVTLGKTAEAIAGMVRRKSGGEDKLFRVNAVREMFADIATQLYHRFIESQGLKHKQRMPLLAMMYEVIRKETGAMNAFYGPEFDSFLYTRCGIDYNTSKDKKGRYRQVGDIWKKLFLDSDEGVKSREYKDMNSFVEEKLGGKGTSRRDAPVPVTLMFRKI